MKCARGDKENVICFDHAVTRVDRGPFDNGKDVALDPLTGNVRPVPCFASGNLIYLVEEDDAGRLDPLGRGPRNGVHVDEPFLLFRHEIFHRLIDAHLAALGAALKEIAQHVLHVDTHLFDAHRAGELDSREVLLADFHLDQAIIQLARSQLGAQLLARARKVLVLRFVVGYECRRRGLG